MFKKLALAGALVLAFVSPANAACENDPVQPVLTTICNNMGGGVVEPVDRYQVSDDEVS